MPEANIAAGEALHGLADVLPDAVTVRLDEEPADLAALLAPYEGRRLVVVARDAARHAWQEAVVAAARTVRPNAIVVETGIPGDGSVDRHARRRPREPRGGRRSAVGLSPSRAIVRGLSRPAWLDAVGAPGRSRLYAPVDGRGP